MRFFTVAVALACALPSVVVAQSSSSVASRTSSSLASSSSRPSSSSTSSRTSTSSSAAPRPSLYLSASSVVQCGKAQVSWGGGQAPYDLTVAIDNAGDPDPIYNSYNTYSSFRVRARAGTRVVFTIIDNSGATVNREYYVGGSGETWCLPSTSSSRVSSSTSSRVTSASATPAVSTTRQPTTSAAPSTSQPATSSSTSATGTLEDAANTAALGSGTPNAVPVEGKRNVAAIAGGAAGGALALLAIIVAVILLIRRRRRKVEYERPVYRRWSEGRVQTPYVFGGDMREVDEK